MGQYGKYPIMPHSTYPILPISSGTRNTVPARSQAKVDVNNRVFLLAYKIPYQHSASFRSKPLLIGNCSTKSKVENKIKILIFTAQRRYWLHIKTVSSDGVVFSRDLSKPVIAGLLWALQGMFSLYPILPRYPILSQFPLRMRRSLTRYLKRLHNR